jgi:hypothetical protein
VCNVQGANVQQTAVSRAAERRTLGFDEPAKPALMEELPLSITTGWFSKTEAASAAPSSAPLMVGSASLLRCCVHRKQNPNLVAWNSESHREHFCSPLEREPGTPEIQIWIGHGKEAKGV